VDLLSVLAFWLEIDYFVAMNFGIIADGNRRWAQKNGLSTEEGHRKGFSVVTDYIYPVLVDSKEFSAMTVYAFSTENWKRSVSEVRYLMKLYAEMIDKWIPDLMKRKTRVIHAGRKNRIPSFLRKKIEEAEEISKKNKDFTIYLCLDYGGRDEILRAAKKGNLEKNLEVPDLDLVFRPGGEMRLSNFCIWQAAYAEFFFTDKFLPEITKADVKKTLKEFLERERRKGA